MSFKIDYASLINAYKRHLAWILLASVLCGVCFFVYSKYFIPELYVSTSKVYVIAQLDEQGRTTSGILNSSKALIKSASIVLKSDEFLTRVGQQIDPPLTASQIRGCVSYTSVSDTEVMQISVTTGDRNLSYILCQVISGEVPAEMKTVAKAGDWTVFDSPKMPTSKSYPDNKEYAMTGAIVAFCIYVVVILLLHLLDNSVKRASDVKERLGIPVLGEVPSFDRVARKNKLTEILEKGKDIATNATNKDGKDSKDGKEKNKGN